MDQILNRFSSADELKLSVGALNIQAKAMREINDAVGVSFQDQSKEDSSIEGQLKIVRIEQSKEGFYYGAAIPAT